MSEMVIDLQEVWEKLNNIPNKTRSGGRRFLTNEEEWIAWEMYPKKAHRTVAQSLHIDGMKLKEEYERLKAQGGPKGEKPAWMK